MAEKRPRFRVSVDYHKFKKLYLKIGGNEKIDVPQIESRPDLIQDDNGNTTIAEHKDEKGVCKIIFYPNAFPNRYQSDLATCKHNYKETLAHEMSHSLAKHKHINNIYAAIHNLMGSDFFWLHIPCVFLIAILIAIPIITPLLFVFHPFFSNLEKEFMITLGIAISFLFFLYFMKISYIYNKYLDLLIWIKERVTWRLARKYIKKYSSEWEEIIKITELET